MVSNVYVKYINTKYLIIFILEETQFSLQSFVSKNVVSYFLINDKVSGMRKNRQAEVRHQMSNVIMTDPLSWLFKLAKLEQREVL